MRDKDQKMRFNGAELSLMKGLFAENEELLYLVRKVVLGFDINDAEKDILRSVVNESVNVLLWKIFLPSIEPDAPFGQVTDLVLGLGTDLKNLGPDEGWPYIRAKDLEIDFLSQNLKRFTQLDLKPKITLQSLSNTKGLKKDREDMYVNIIARNFILSIVDGNILQVQHLSGLKSETVEETITRLARNSTK